MRKLIPLLPALCIFPIGVLLIESSVLRLLWATLGLLFLLKVGSVIRNIQLSLSLPQKLGWILYFLFWPGMRPESFARRSSQDEEVGHIFVKGFLSFIFGVGIQIVLFCYWNQISTFTRQYLGLFSFLILIHFGVSSMLFVIFRILGWKVESLFMSPFKSTSLRDFWGRRWNLAFVDMDKRLFLPLFPTNLPKAVSFVGIFLLSGILHETGISYPANSGWGGPLLYFAIHGALTWIEPKLPVINSSRTAGRIWLWVCILLPLPLLFHQPFLKSFIEPYFTFGHNLASSMKSIEVLKWAILACGLGHFLVLVATFQVPKKLNWHEEFSKLSRFNKKIFWTYGGYIVFCIVSFGIIDLINAKDLMDINPSSLAIALFISIFWTARVIVDFSYYKHTDWPPGDEFVVGHTCLTTLFCFLALTHWSLVLWQLTQN